MRRLTAAGARVEPRKLPSGKHVGEARVWLPAQATPGLLLSRSLGDSVATRIGCTSVPEVTFCTLRPQDGYVVIASDGVWDVLANERVRAALSQELNLTE
jgi:serine/threonine protein phosphatase PrpC